MSTFMSGNRVHVGDTVIIIVIGHHRIRTANPRIGKIAIGEIAIGIVGAINHKKCYSPVRAIGISNITIKLSHSVEPRRIGISKISHNLLNP
ncbi:MAG: hypothetical protein ACD_63C00192G0001 [uncultured bacterium]|nr:MAG: hypothetical protein ACD_63C00192G0001 [uncultured bacterium]